MTRLAHAAVTAALLLAATGALSRSTDTAAQADAMSTTLTSTQPCNRCAGFLLPGTAVPHPETGWGIISDLPESFSSHGVLYCTRAALPGNGAPEELLLQQRAAGFRSIDAGFDVFIFHLLRNPGAAARIVVHVRNLGATSATLVPRQVIKTEGVIGTLHEFESDLGRRVLAGDWDTSVPRVTIAPGAGRVVAFGRQFGSVPEESDDASRNVNCFGYVRCLVEEARQPELEVSVVAIPAGPRPEIDEETRNWLDVGARTTDEVSLGSAPRGCALKRAVGVYRNFRWKSGAVVVDAARLTTEGLGFPIGLPAIQAAGCEAARQTQDMVLHPGYARGETVGNYMIGYDVRFMLRNSGSAPVKMDVTFGKKEADVGLAFRARIDDDGGDGAAGSWDGVPVRSRWAGPKQAAPAASFLDAPVMVKPGECRSVCLEFLVCGNSSLPFMLSVLPSPH